jgi:hypothetical protein
MRFLKYFGAVFEWYSKMAVMDKYESTLLLTQIVFLLSKLNDKSLYYNTLTSDLMVLKLQNGKTILRNLFEAGSIHNDTNFAEWIIDVLFKMFSITEFKEILLKEYFECFNTVANFETTKFKRLLPQLFMNKELAKKVINKYKLCINPRGREYDVL